MRRFCGEAGRLWPLPLAAALAGCGAKATTEPSASAATAPSAAAQATPQSTSPASPVRFTDVTTRAGIRFRHTNGGFGIGLQAETMGSGVAFIDYDGDGYQDIFFVNSRHWTEAELEQWKHSRWSMREKMDFQRAHPPGTPLARRLPAAPPQGRVTGALYRNNRDGTFSDVTRAAGLDVEMYGMGAAVGDYDNDGRPDLYVAGYGRNYLFRNQSTPGGPRFQDVTDRAGVRDSGWSSSPAWIDYDKDGRLDLFVCRFMKWTPGNNIYATLDGIHIGYAHPTMFKGEPSRLYRNLGGGRFQDVSARAGVAIESKGLAVATCDTNNDGWPDIIVANDSAPNFLFQNNKDGTFSEVAAKVGIAYSAEGVARAGMGLDTADIDHSNQDSIVVSNFAQEMVGLYYNDGHGVFLDMAPQTSVGKASEKSLSWGVSFSDFNNDGWPDLMVANGHVNTEYTIGVPGITYAQKPLLFLNDGRGLFQEVGPQSGDALQKKLVARGLACADIDLDGDVDAVLSSNGGPALLMRNDSANAHGVIRLVLRGSKSNRSGIGTLVKVKLSERDGLRRWVRSGSSYLSQSELPLTLGLRNKARALAISLHWPSGHVTRLRDVAANQILTVDEAKGVIRKQPLQSRPPSP